MQLKKAVFFQRLEKGRLPTSPHQSIPAVQALNQMSNIDLSKIYPEQVLDEVSNENSRSGKSPKGGINSIDAEKSPTFSKCHSMISCQILFLVSLIDRP